MSFAGALTFKRNLETLMRSDAFKKADHATRLRMGGLLLRSKFGAPIFGRVQTLKIHQSAGAGDVRIYWEGPDDAKYMLGREADSTGAVSGCVVKLRTPVFDGGPQIRQAWWDTCRNRFVCSATARDLGEEPTGWALDGGRTGR